MPRLKIDRDAGADAIAASGRIRRERDVYIVRSKDGMREYVVTPFSCSCPDFINRGIACKHIRAVSMIAEPRVPQLPSDPFEGF